MSADACSVMFVCSLLLMLCSHASLRKHIPTTIGRDLRQASGVCLAVRDGHRARQNGFAYPSGFDPMDWLISQRLPSGSAKYAVRSPQGWLVGGLRNVTPLALSASYAASTSSTPAARSTRDPPPIFSSSASSLIMCAAAEASSRKKYTFSIWKETVSGVLSCTSSPSVSR